MKQVSNYIIAGILLLVAFGISTTLFYSKNIVKDDKVLETLLQQDERSVIHAINSISKINQNENLQQVEQSLTLLNPRLSFNYEQENGELITWHGNVSESDLIRSKGLPGGKSLTIGWNLTEGELSTIKGLSGSYRPTLANQDIVLHGNIKSYAIEYHKAKRKHWLKWLITFLFFCSFSLCIRALAKSNYVASFVGIPLAYIGYSICNRSFFYQISLYHDVSLELTPWAPSLLDLLMLTVALFAFYVKDLKLNVAESKFSLVSHVLSTIFLFVAVILSLYQFISSPAININFNELSSLSILEGISLVCIVSWTLLIFLRTQLLVQSTNKKTSIYKYTCYFIIAVALMLVGAAYAHIQPFWVLPTFILVYLILSDLYYDIGAKNITWLILWLVVISGFLSILLFGFDYQKDLNQKQLLLSSYYHPFDQQMFSEIMNLHELQNDNLISKIKTHPRLGVISANDLIESTFGSVDDLVIELTGNTQNNTSIYTQNGLAEVMPDTKQYRNIDKNWRFDPVNNQYIAYNTFINGNDTIYHETAYKKYIANDDSNIPITITRNGKILRNDLKLSEEKILEIQSNVANSIVSERSIIIKHSPYSDTLLISEKPILSILKPITLFSFFFCLLTILIIVIMILNSAMKFLPDFLPLQFTSETSLSTRIQIIIVGMVIFSFIAIASITSIYLQNQIAKNRDTEIQNRIITVTNNMYWHLRDTDNTEKAPYILENIRQELETIHKSKIKLFDTSGKNVRQGSEELMPYLAYYYFKQYNSSNAFTITNNGHESSYIPIIKNGRRPVMYASLDQSKNIDSQLGVIDYLGTLLNVYVFLFLIAGAVALAIAKSITEPLETLATRMTQIKLNRKNNPVNWKADDEIGKLIKNYNVMIHELEDSAKLIARTERDVAWKEMARNVAHEIKNPLTPMKLSIQYLERAVGQDPSQALPLVRRISNTLIEQIDNLAEIASAFSNFGKMPQATNEKVVLNEVVETNHDLFRKRDDMDIRLSETIEDLVVFADKNHLVSILNNIVKNAIQAIPNDRKGIIEIALYKENDNAVIRVTDNGVGISEDEKKKIFTPNFTTKSSGSGLGLAISANMVEAFNGSLYFDSTENVGSKFYISIPLMKQFSIRSDKNTIGLDED